MSASICLAIVYFFLFISVGLQLYYVHNRDIEEQSLIDSQQKSSGHDEGKETINFYESSSKNGRGEQPSSRDRSTLNTKKLFIMTCLLSCLLRLMSFCSMTIVDLSAIRRGESNLSETNPSKYDDAVTGTETFFEKAFLVLFDFPDFCVISAYCLLIVIWGEAYLQVGVVGGAISAFVV
jgi:hypothetical protein